MQLRENKYDVGVIVGRFQVHQMTPSHKNLIDFVFAKHPKIIIFLGNPPTLGTRNNPLDFEMRKQMILTDYPEAIVLIANDNVSDEIWSKNLDAAITSVTTPNQKVVLYGGRDSFISHYHGRFPTLELEAEQFSGTDVRKQVSVKAINSPEFRAGVIWAQYNQYPKVFATVDIAIIRRTVITDDVSLLMAKKPNEKLFRFVGGFTEPDSDSFELDAKREVMEEVGVEVSWPKYLGSFKVQDWRYRKEVDKIKTLFFVCEYVFGDAKANDDIAHCEWIELGKIKDADLVVEHRPLFARLVDYITNG